MLSNKMLCNGLAPLLLARILRTCPTNTKSVKLTTTLIERHWCAKRIAFMLSDTGIETTSEEVSLLDSSLHSPHILTVQQSPMTVTTDNILVSMDLTAQSPMSSNNVPESTEAAATPPPCTFDTKIQAAPVE
ncbi:d3ee822e-12d5-4428-8cf2-492f2f428a5e [Sclerotinia trifoliorum]|uniref:D3ee822e-12d5-4428-8cf2-492f2f428a5e n=1 Tax=Sclerotinia trifoliorum TaxID=28548 RepID=A0A8H2VLW5_9HELO|nr:d3ee822e-12d5-4428-8cf2-492f2f428a5e [Sclerotinia trifoliorum]